MSNIKSLEHIYDISLTNHDPSMKYKNCIRHDIDYVIGWNCTQNRLCDKSEISRYGVISI